VRFSIFVQINGVATNQKPENIVLWISKLWKLLFKCKVDAFQQSPKNCPPLQSHFSAYAPGPDTKIHLSV
jgi:hypothetical protein